MDERIKFFVGLDAHKDSTSVAACEAGREPARFVGTMGPDVQVLLKVLAKAGDPAQVSVVYEAGPTGYGLCRELRRRGYRCEIVAPTLIPRRAGDRIKNDRRDCARLAELSRSGELKPIWVSVLYENVNFNHAIVFRCHAKSFDLTSDFERRCCSL